MINRCLQDFDQRFLNNARTTERGEMLTGCGVNQLTAGRIRHNGDTETQPPLIAPELRHANGPASEAVEWSTGM